MYNNPMAFVVQGMLNELVEEGEISSPRWVSRVRQVLGWTVRRVAVVLRMVTARRESEPRPDLELTRAA